MLCHKKHEGVMYCVALKATSRTAVYDNNPAKMAGAVCYDVGETCFKRRTVIDPDNPWPIAHQDIVKHRRNKAFAVIGQMPADFDRRLTAAIKASATMSPKKQRSMLSMLRET